ncbi:hypothetical protein BCR33DRAFT_186950 [Rhizoclosmatium globosum]|uniref:Uncharacterized protein n=1 Tax=Rhizoclosmatium globosum TaxID=329046 RepID=A0A1Y2D1D5_9FUNG|nr:hypothetical protein BCR33DRAFT_186950 [Rhizoclosmatium globosum]|eukprot:ORY53101.1 hypothetical protein BCR33DRAFT_186950 [Rhizoclosmatium globosum]
MAPEKRTLSINVPPANPHTVTGSSNKKAKKSKIAANEAKVSALQVEIDKVRSRVRAEADKNKDDEEMDLEDLVFGAATLDDDGEKLKAILSGEAAKRKAADVIGEQIQETVDEVAGRRRGGRVFVIDRKKPTIVGESTTEEAENNRVEVVEDPKSKKDCQNQRRLLLGGHFRQRQPGLKAVDISTGSNRTRKLREAEDETSISTQEFENRLRKQFLNFTQHHLGL